MTYSYHEKAPLTINQHRYMIYRNFLPQLTVKLPTLFSPNLLGLTKMLALTSTTGKLGGAVLGPVSHGRTVSFTSIRLLVFGYYEYQYLYASNRFIKRHP